jgi:amino acid transporter
MASAAVPAAQKRELLKRLSWKDAFVLALANPGFLIASIGASIGAIGAWAAVLLWTISMLFGLLNAWVYTELATMFPNKTGGLALYANEAWRRYSTIVGPVVTFGYWFAWSTVLAIFGLIIGTLIQQQWFPSATFTLYTIGSTHIGLSALIAGGLIVTVWLFNIFGIRPSVRVAYVTGGLLVLDMAVLVIGAFVSGQWHPGRLTWTMGSAGPSWKVALVWLFIMGWSAYGTEVCATFAPEYKDTSTDTRKALRRSSVFSLGCYALIPLALGGLVTQKTAAANPVGLFSPVFNGLVGKGAGDAFVAFLCASLFLSMNTSTADGGRALCGIARDGMTIRQLAHLNRFHIPGRAMTLDLFVNLGLVFLLGQTVSILFAGNLGYFLSVLAALSGFILLRKDRPGWPRPIRLPRVWLGVAAFLFCANLAFIIFGITNPGITGYGGMTEVMIGVGVLLLSVVLLAFRRIVQDKQPFLLRDKHAQPPAPELLINQPSTVEEV